MQNIDAFISRWSASHGSERGNSQRFLTELIAAFDLPPMPTAPEDVPAYEFEHQVPYKDDSGKVHDLRIDLYKRGCFVLESKQGIEAREQTPLEKIAARPSKAGTKRGTSAWDRLMDRAFHQAEDYVRRLPPDEGRPPFIIVLDVGFSFDVYAEFSRTGGLYAPFPAAGANRFVLADLAKPEVAEMLTQIWTDPLALDPSRRSAKVTREIAAHLAELAKALETQHSPEEVAAFLMRCLFSMFAEDVGLLPNACFQHILESSQDKPEGFAPTAEELWRAMNSGGWSVAIGDRIPRFNGGIFTDPRALPLERIHIAVLLKAARADWREVEPAIFGTLLERALNPRERHKLGAHFTPRAYVERLVAPTLITPLREEWRTVQAAAAMAAEEGDTPRALKIVSTFQKKLCLLRILDPACGTGNFLYVAFELLKRLEAEVLQEENRYGGTRLFIQGAQAHIDPHQFLGLEINPRAAYIAEMVLWIGYLQWHFRTHGSTLPSEPIIRSFHNIECRDAILNYDSWSYRTDASGQPVMRWDGHSTKVDPVTGRDVPDADKQTPDMVYKNPRPATWPEAEYIIGNPPFLGGSSKRGVLGQGYFEALGSVYPNLPESCDLVMYWWHKAAEQTRLGKTKRFGFITTNSISQTFNRRVISLHLNAGLSLFFVIPSHPWVDSADGAAVRIAMTAGHGEFEAGELQSICAEKTGMNGEIDVELNTLWGKINADLTIGTDIASTNQLRANEKISNRGVVLHGSGFIVNPEEAKWLGLGKVPGIEKHIRNYRNGKDLTGNNRNVMVIDLFGLTEIEVMDNFPAVFQWIKEKVKPERDHNPREARRTKWWLFGETIRTFRPALQGLPRFIATVETAKHRIFMFLDASILPDNMLVNIATDDAYVLGVLSSRLHIIWALAAGGDLGGNTPRYNKTRCFETFPFPAATPAQRERIRTLGEQLDAHRKARQAEHPTLTLTAMYNALEKLHSGLPFTAAEQKSHEQALGTVLLTLHNDLDAAVAEAYGWPVGLSDADILTRLVALNKQRAAEEQNGHVRWLRPEYQAPESVAAQAALPVDLPAVAASAPKSSTKIPWPKDETGRVAVVLKILRGFGREAQAQDIAAGIKGASAPRIEAIAASLASHGLIRRGENGYLG